MCKYRTQSFISVFGLAFAIACFIPALYWIRYETSYDSFYPEAESIYRLYAVEKHSGKINKGVSRILEKKLHEHFSAVKNSTVFITDQENCRTKETPHVRLRILYTDSTFFNVFPQIIIYGDAIYPLQTVNNIVLTKSVAIRLFGNVENAIGQNIQTTMRSSLPPYTVRAVINDPPPNTNLSFDAILFHDMLKYFSELPEEVQWKLFFMELYVKFHPDTDMEKLAEELCDFTSELNVNDNIELRMMSINDVHHYLDTDVPFSLNLIRLFATASMLLLFGALFNFLSLHLNLLRQRIREFRIRAIYGASSGLLIKQMIFELVCAVILALLFGYLFIIIVRPIFSNLLDIVVDIPQLIILFIFCGAGIISLLFFISFILFWRLSHFSLQTLSKEKNTRQSTLQRIAVTLQLIISIVFIIASLIIMMQMHFVNRKNLGFDSAGIIQLSDFTDYSGKIQTTLMHELAGIPQIEIFTDTSFEPQHNASPSSIITEVEWQGKSQNQKSAFHFVLTDSKFAETFRLKMLTGKWWDENEKQKIVLNEEAVRVMNLTEPVGTIIRLPSLEDNSIIKEYEVSGVVNDFHILSLRNRIHPNFFIPSTELYNILYIRTMPGQEWEVIRLITSILPNISPTLADVTLTPMSELYHRLNLSEQIGLKIFFMLATVCLLISLFGIYAITDVSTQSRRKEVAIRKVMGAKVSEIICMFFREYLLYVIISCVIAFPVAFIAMNYWLEGYAYRTNISWWWLLTGVIAGIVVVVLLTISKQIINAAKSNPIDIIKDE